MFQLRWIHVAASAVSHTVNLDDGIAYYTLTFGISAQQLLPGRNLTTSSGIMWADCIYVAHEGTTTLVLTQFCLAIRLHHVYCTDEVSMSKTSYFKLADSMVREFIFSDIR